MTFLCNMIQNLIQASKSAEQFEPYHETLEYIKLDGTQYFNPDLLTNADYTIEARFKLTDTSRSSSVFGGRNTSANPMNGNQLHYIYTNGKTQYIGGYSTAELAVENTITLNDVCEVVCDKTGFSIAKNGGTPTKYSRAFSAVQYTTDLMIGATYTKTGNSIQWGFKGELYMFKVRLSGELIRDYVPSLDSQLRPCLYERVSKTFLYAKKLSDNTTAYDLGFKRWNKFDVDYISFTGTQRIPTGIKPQVDIKTDITFRSDYTGMTASCLIGARYAASGTRKAYAVWQCVGGSNTNPQSGYMRADLGNSSTGSDSIGKSYSCANWTNFVKDSEDNYLNNEFKTANTSYDFDFEKTSVDINIGCMANGSVGTDEEPLTPTYSNNFIGDIGRCIMYVEDVLTRDYKPVIWHNGNTTAEACLYDEVYNKMHTNAGTGTLKAYIENTLGVPYEVGMYVQTLKSSNTANAGYVVELGEYPQDGMGYHIKTTTDSTSSNYLFGSRLTTSGNLAIATLLGSSTGGTILSGVMGGSITWKSGTTTWARSGSGTTYECSLQTYKDGNTYKFDVIGYNYTLGKEADRQTQTYPSPIDEQQNAPMLLFGAVNTVNILFGNNSHYFIEWNLPNVRHTLLPVINSTHTKICFIDNRTKQTYEFIKVGSYTPTTNNITFKQLDGTIITGTLT